MPSLLYLNKFLAFVTKKHPPLIRIIGLPLFYNCAEGLGMNLRKGANRSKGTRESEKEERTGRKQQENLTKKSELLEGSHRIWSFRYSMLFTVQVSGLWGLEFRVRALSGHLAHARANSLPVLLTNIFERRPGFGLE